MSSNIDFNFSVIVTINSHKYHSIPEAYIIYINFKANTAKKN